MCFFKYNQLVIELKQWGRKHTLGLPIIFWSIQIYINICIYKFANYNEFIIRYFYILHYILTPTKFFSLFNVTFDHSDHYNI